VVRVVAGFADLAGVRDAYLRAVEDGADELVVELPAGVLGVAPGEAMGTLALAAIGAGRQPPPPLHVTLRASAGRCVLAGIPLRIHARRVTLEGVALAGTVGVALAATASEAIALRDVAVLRATPGDDDPAAVVLTATGTEGTALALERVVVGRTATANAVLALACGSGAWWSALELADCVVAGAADALLAIDAVERLRLRGCTLDGAATRTLLRLAWPAVDGELAGCDLTAAAGALLEVRNATPREPPPLRLTAATALSVPPGELPAALAADDTVTRGAAGASAAIARAADALVALDGRLADRLR
jgi:hypothetical protein